RADRLAARAGGAAGPPVRAAPGVAVAELPVPGVVGAVPAVVRTVQVVARRARGVLVPAHDVAGAVAVLPAARLARAHRRGAALDALLGVVPGVCRARPGGGVG